MIGNSATGGTELSFSRMFNVHNSVSLAGYGFFPPIFYQGLFNKGDPDMNPVDGRRMISNASKNDFQLFFKIIIVIFFVVFFVL